MTDAPIPPPDPDAAVAATVALHRLILGVLSMVLAAVGMASIMLVPMSDAKLAIVAGFTGTMFGWAGACFTFYFGTSQGSVDKGGIMSRAFGALRP